ncbi:MAG: hypothetical protein HQK49_17175 [Oligoflexia bacterium]|nr:hypothetical protein [Oligoflexia bacterium]
MIEFVYHLKPNNLNGNTLYPLNVLRDIYPDSYNFHIQKYSYRKELMKAKFPIANCLWNDVLHLSPVDIGILIDNQISIFRATEKEKYLDLERINNRKYYKIDIRKLNSANLYIYNTLEASNDMDETMDKIKEQFYDWENGNHLLSNQITTGQIAYFNKCSENLSLPRYLFTAIPHVLYLGNIDLAITEEITYQYK